MIYFRNDDVSGNTDIGSMMEGYEVICDLFPDAEIWSAMSPLCKMNRIGSVYPGVPFKDKPQNWFYNVDDFLILRSINIKAKHKIVSHGLIHFDHNKADKLCQELSILTSCNLLKTNIFVPPFNRFNQDTVDICNENNITLVGKDENWLNLESNKFNIEHKFWYYHSWRLGPEKLREILSCKVAK